MRTLGKHNSHTMSSITIAPTMNTTAQKPALSMRRRSWKRNRVCVPTRCPLAASGSFASKSFTSRENPKQCAAAASRWLPSPLSRSQMSATNKHDAKSNACSPSGALLTMCRKHATDAMWIINSCRAPPRQLRPADSTAVLLSLLLPPARFLSLLPLAALRISPLSPRREGDLQAKPLPSPDVLLERKSQRTPENGATALAHYPLKQMQ